MAVLALLDSAEPAVGLAGKAVADGSLSVSRGLGVALSLVDDTVGLSWVDAASWSDTADEADSGSSSQLKSSWTVCCDADDQQWLHWYKILDLPARTAFRLSSSASIIDL